MGNKVPAASGRHPPTSEADAVESDEIPAPLLLKAHSLFQRHFARDPLARLSPASVVHQDLTHEAARPLRRNATGSASVGCVDQPGVVDFLTAMGLFIGQSNEFFQLLRDLAENADEAAR